VLAPTAEGYVSKPDNTRESNASESGCCLRESGLPHPRLATIKVLELASRGFSRTGSRVQESGLGPLMGSGTDFLTSNGNEVDGEKDHDSAECAQLNIFPIRPGKWTELLQKTPVDPGPSLRETVGLARAPTPFVSSPPMAVDRPLRA
jgi:hypothetical protein